MKWQINCLLAALLAVSQLSSGYAKSVPSKEETPQVQTLQTPASTQSQPAPNAAAIGRLVNSTELGSTTSGLGGAAQNATAMVSATELGSSQRAEGRAATTVAVVKHIVRKKRTAMEVDAPYDLHTTHMFCDFDERGRHRIVLFFPNHCIWVWNNKYAHEGFYHLFKLYQTEAFFFGQYNERLKQYETVAHVWTAD
ncbi:uncharacterized protein LOC111082278 [Drosophila obscura]|uniref:uncharacterized protein LOC111082278 n=1 Tax=Drosophila obscura TaxID=7282 RepID=UPI001BB1E3B6|nr:uncharacterized protein LOC111082278 [Drosophila obscura]